MELIEPKTRTARKRLSSPCLACSLPILPGDRYVDSMTIVDRGIFAVRWHVECQEEIEDCNLSEADGFWEAGILAAEGISRSNCTTKWTEWFTQREDLVKELVHARANTAMETTRSSE